LTWRPSYEGFGRRPMRERGCRQEGRRTKASQGGNRGEEGRCTTGRDLWGFEDCERIADVRAEPSGAQSCRREHGRRARSVVSRRSGVGAAPGADLRTRRGQRCRAPARGWRRKRSALRGGMRDGGHEVSILMRLGDGDCAGRTPSNVSTMIMRPPQQGQRRAGETSSASPSTSSGGRSGATEEGQSNWRARSTLRARTALAKRP